MDSTVNLRCFEQVGWCYKIVTLNYKSDRLNSFGESLPNDERLFSRDFTTFSPTLRLLGGATVFVLQAQKHPTRLR